MQDGAGRHRRCSRRRWVVDQRAPARAEVPGVAAQVPDVLVAADRPEARARTVDGILGAQPRQHVVVVVPERRTGVALSTAEVDAGPAGPRTTVRAYCAPRCGLPADSRSCPAECRPTASPADRVSASAYPASPEHAPLCGLDEFLIHNAPYPGARDVDARRPGLRAGVVHLPGQGRRAARRDRPRLLSRTSARPRPSPS